jgi:hypothetical protein
VFEIYLTILEESCIINHTGILNKESVFQKIDKILIEQHVKQGFYRTTANEY